MIDTTFDQELERLEDEFRGLPVIRTTGIELRQRLQCLYQKFNKDIPEFIIWGAEYTIYVDDNNKRYIEFKGEKILL